MQGQACSQHWDLSATPSPVAKQRTQQTASLRLLTYLPPSPEALAACHLSPLLFTSQAGNALYWGAGGGVGAVT